MKGLLRSRSSRRGFTMVELLVVIIIISVLVAVALPRYFAAIYAGRVRACQSNFKIINTAAQAYFAQNKDWPTDVGNMLPPGDLNAMPVAGMKGGQLTELPICPFETTLSLKPYNLTVVYEDPADAMSPPVGVVTDWNGHFATQQWQNATN
ncbi:MAG: prepilin-type N-terminal cleavage/methylation domain-containing protein, partial [Proteobacteria bacterium]|nr:prepilin-type N-terminal cleavage/methylation domain-containing protein [Pseudomonadota bacterium]